MALSRRRQVLADGALVGVTFIWGSTFVLVKDLVAQTPPLLLLSVRFGIGSVALFLVITLLGRWRGFTMRELGWGALIGVAIGIGYPLQTIGIQYTTASNAGFITGLLVVIAPVLGVVLLKQRPHAWALLGVAMATVGLALLSLNFEAAVKVNKGDLIVLGCAFAFALQVVLIAHVARWADPLRLAMVQILMAAVISTSGTFFFEPRVDSLSPEVWAGAAFLGIVATGAAIAVQVGVQRYTSVVHASLIYTLEPVFAALFGFWLQGDRLGSVALMGAGLIVTGMLVAEIGPYLMGRKAVGQT